MYAGSTLRIPNICLAFLRVCQPNYEAHLSYFGENLDVLVKS